MNTRSMEALEQRDEPESGFRVDFVVVSWAFFLLRAVRRRGGHRSGLLLLRYGLGRGLLGRALGGGLGLGGRRGLGRISRRALV